MIRAVDVFTPSDFPKYTYVERGGEQLERRLRDALATPGEVVSVSGPSKSGKTVLVEKVVGSDALITVTGAGIRSPDHLWERVLDWMGAPSSISSESSVTGSIEIGGEAKGGLSIPFVGAAEVAGNAGVSGSRSKGTTQLSGRTGMPQVVQEIGGSEFVLLIDDFHYMKREIAFL